MYSYVPGAVKVTRKRVMPGFDCTRLARSCGVGVRNPEFTLSEGELMTAVRAPSAVRDDDTFSGGRGSAGSVPKVTVWLIEGSRLVHSTVSPTRTTTTFFENRINDADCEPAPLIVITSPIPAAMPPLDAPASSPPLTCVASLDASASSTASSRRA